MTPSLCCASFSLLFHFFEHRSYDSFGSLKFVLMTRSIFCTSFSCLACSLNFVLAPLPVRNCSLTFAPMSRYVLCTSFACYAQLVELRTHVSFCSMHFVLMPRSSLCISFPETFHVLFSSLNFAHMFCSIVWASFTHIHHCVHVSFTISSDVSFS